MHNETIPIILLTAKSEIEIRNGKMGYDFKINATTGVIVEYKEDLED